MFEINVKNVLIKVDFELKRVFCVEHNGRPLVAHVYGSHDMQPELQCLYQYPSLATSMKLPKTNAENVVQLIEFNKNKKFKLVKAKLDTKLYYVHHHYGKYYMYGQVPAVVTFDSKLYNSFIGSPIFDEQDNVISFVTDCYMDDIGQRILPVTGESYRLHGMICLNGTIRIYGEDDVVQDVFDTNININIIYKKKTVEVYVMYNGETISYVKIKSKFAGNVLIV
ncbi:p26-b [Apocheima cinerarium nucleopolyhedrovirus]|uniref:p26-b n=1 Tax=Apocheima cinerarium nucleopolyhedrovirus TaxID=307461 RepID=UPI0001D9205D|nr:p26-b [Apocheima cinerarium nucleopolyhedrovirus]ADB84401.1 p26-b [Apocheima cinerarium nucleopolyhedrovirus]